jgi:hypothetical protein
MDSGFADFVGAPEWRLSLANAPPPGFEAPGFDFLAMRHLKE